MTFAEQMNLDKMAAAAEYMRLVNEWRARRDKMTFSERWNEDQALERELEMARLRQRETMPGYLRNLPLRAEFPLANRA